MGISSAVSVFNVPIASANVAQRLISSGTGPGADRIETVSGLIKALKGNVTAVYIGTDNTVTAATGFEINPGESIGADVVGFGWCWIIGATVGDRVCGFGVGP